VCQESLSDLVCRVFEPGCRTAELVKPRERDVEVRLVEHLITVDQVAIDRYGVDQAPLDVESV
jgi:hypothetical protein